MNLGEYSFRAVDDMLTSMCNLMFSRVPPSPDSQIRGENGLIYPSSTPCGTTGSTGSTGSAGSTGWSKPVQLSPSFTKKKTHEIHGEPRNPLALSSLEFRILSMRAIEASPAWGTIIPLYCLVKNGIPCSWIDMCVKLYYHSNVYIYNYIYITKLPKKT